ncbi:hypothetical protein GIB67_023901 [Kingdonia uniflora]|uniref:RING-type E3 ubiquitin transferase n=1 Tax=Kingdonia uniflora TaxID=39325 RepID=A0A7J7NG33_9MAGN|nr:hypothetical protein GIB67_023901 [Kingdonia uniflora]
MTSNKGVMEISMLKALLKNLSRFSNLSSSSYTNSEPVHKYYQKIDTTFKLLRPILDVLVDSQIASNEQLNKSFEELDRVVDEASDLIESWHPVESKFYFVMQIESLITRINAFCLDILRLLNSLHQHLPAELNSASVEHTIQKLQYAGHELILTLIKEAVRDEVDNSIPGSEKMVKIADALNLTSNQELLMEAVALEKVKVQAEQDEKNGEAKYIGHIVALVTHMHDLLVDIKQSRSTDAVPIPPDFCCPLSLELMRDPVIVASGQTYERAFIKKWIDLGFIVCPKTRQTLGHTNLIPNYTVKALIANWCESNNVTIPDPLKSLNFNQTSTLLGLADYGPKGLNDIPRSGHAPISSNLSKSSEPMRSLNSPRRSLFSSSGTHLEGTSPPRGHSDLEDAHGSGMGNGFGLDVGRMSLGNSEEKKPCPEDRSLGSSFQSLMPTAKELSEAARTEEQSQGHSRTASVSSNASNTEYFHRTLEDANENSQVSSDLTHYSSDVSGEVSSEPPTPSSLASHSEPEFSPRRVDTRSRSQTIWRRPSERFMPRVVSASAIDNRSDLLGIETQVRKLVEDLQNSSVDIQRDATAGLRLLAKHNMDNRIIISNCGAINLLVGLLHSPDTKTQENAVTALLNLSINDNNKAAIASADAIDPLIHVLETGTAEAKENSAATLFSLSVIEENKVRIGRSGAISPLVELLGNGTPRGKKDAATALFNLSIFHENKARIVQAGAVKYLVELMDPAAGMVDKAVAVLSNLATIPEGRSAIGQEKGIPVLVEVVELGSARGKENAAAALLQLCTNSGKFCSMVLQEGAVPPLVALSQSGTPRAKEKE